MKICWDKLKLFHALLINFTGEGLREYRNSALYIIKWNLPTLWHINAFYIALGLETTGILINFLN